VDYFRKSLEYCKLCDERMDAVTAATAHMLSHYLDAIINKDRECEQEISEYLESRRSRGWKMVG
jgi:hypothetical protein